MAHRALQHLDRAEACVAVEAASATLAFVRLKIYLDLRDAAAAEEQVLRACRCRDFSQSVLEVIAMQSLPLDRGVMTANCSSGQSVCDASSSPMIAL